jgi:broad specificity phosphatase PhoE
MILYCVRHGESTYNAEGRIQGQSDVPLSELGLRQGRAVASALADYPIDVIYSSPLKRAHDTAQMASATLGLDVQTDDRLMELNAGVFQDKLRSELAELYPDELARWVAGDPDFVIPGGESRDDLSRRGVEVLREIGTRGHAHTAVITHGRLLITTVKALLGMSLEAEPQSLQNGSITRIELNGSSQPKLIAIDQVEHLAGVGLAGRGDL